MMHNEFAITQILYNAHPNIKLHVFVCDSLDVEAYCRDSSDWLS